MTYKDKLIEAMHMLAENNKTIFIGQSVLWQGTGLYWTIKDIPNHKKIELPIMEDAQMGISLGLSLEGFIPISIYPRMDFLILACNQLVNHLDKMEELSTGRFKPKVIIRTSIGSVKPLFPGVQHNQDHCEALRKMLTNVDVIKLEKADEIIPAYKKALESERSTLLIEIPDLYETE